MSNRIKSIVYQCQFCGKDFHPFRRAAQFCSRSCQTRVLWQSRPELRQQAAEVMKELIARPEVQEKIQQHLRGPENPIFRPEVRAKALAVQREKGFSNLSGGNGKGLTVPQRLLAQRLAWPTEYVVATGEGWKPEHYKLDLAEPTLRIAVEVDGQSHRSKKVAAADARKDRWLREHGWSVLRFWNSQIMDDFETVVAEIMEAVMSSTSKQPHPTISRADS